MTGWLHDGSASLGFQLTFFRTRPGRAEDNPSAFAAHQLLIGHAALADLATGHLLHAERIARGGFDLAYAREGVTDVAIDRWTLKAQDRGYVAQAQTRDFAFALMLTATQPAPVEWRARLQPQRPRPARRELLLQPAAAGGERHVDARAPNGPRDGDRLARSRMVQQLRRCRRDRLGLVWHQSGRWRRADGVSDAPRRWRRGVGRRDLARRERRCLNAGRVCGAVDTPAAAGARRALA